MRSVPERARAIARLSQEGLYNTCVDTGANFVHEKKRQDKIRSEIFCIKTKDSYFVHLKGAKLKEIVEIAQP